MRRTNDGLRKTCDCNGRNWAKCPHPWHFNFKWNGEHYRFTLERKVHRVIRDAKGKWRRDRATLGDRVEDKTTAKGEVERLRAEIRAGRLQAVQEPETPKLQQETLTLSALLATYRKQYLLVHRSATVKNTDYVIGAIKRTPLAKADGTECPFGDWLVADITTETIEQYQERRRTETGATGSNRHLEILRHMFNWATSKKRKLAVDNPFMDGTKAAIKMLPELGRHRRLYSGEAERLQAACSPHLWAIVLAALETGMRRGEILSLQWAQVRFEPKQEIVLTAAKTKTKRDRIIPISTKLRALLDMRRYDEDGKERPAADYVFGYEETGEQLKGFKRAWQAAVLRANGHKVEYVTKLVNDRKVRTASLTKESQERLRAIDLHFHDLRREAGSRWLDAGIPLTKIQKWLGHTTVAQTSAYLIADGDDDNEWMRRAETRQTELQRTATGAEQGDHNQPRTAEMRDDEPRNSSTISH